LLNDKEVIWQNLAARGFDDPVHRGRSGNAMTVNVAMHRLRADIYRRRKSWDRDFLLGQVGSKVHEVHFTILVNSPSSILFTILALVQLTTLAKMRYV
jgi:hypothetical protein